MLVAHVDRAKQYCRLFTVTSCPVIVIWRQFPEYGHADLAAEALSGTL